MRTFTFLRRARFISDQSEHLLSDWFRKSIIPVNHILAHSDVIEMALKRRKGESGEVIMVIILTKSCFLLFFSALASQLTNLTDSAF